MADSGNDSRVIKDVIIVGAGPAGIAAAIQLNRYGIKSHVFEKARAGGLLYNANCVENYPGFPGGISGISLVRLMTQQLKNAHIELDYELVYKISHDKMKFIVETNANTYFSRILIISSGTKPTKFEDVPIDETLLEYISYEIGHILDISDRKILIVGGGDAAFDYALNLARNNRVIILNRGSETKCLPLLWQRASVNNRIEYHKSSAIDSICASESHNLRINYRSKDTDRKVDIDYLVFAIGREPELDFLSDDLRRRMADLQNRDLLYLAGDIKNDTFRQTAIAAGDGIRAAMQIARKLRGSIK